jgi:hypothetical protein
LAGLSRSLDRSDALDRALRDSAEEVRAEASDDLVRDGGASANALANSLEVERSRSLAYRVVSKAPLAWFREFGAMRRAQRPWLRPALDRARPRILMRLTQALRRAFRRQD